MSNEKLKTTKPPYRHSAPFNKIDQVLINTLVSKVSSHEFCPDYLTCSMAKLERAETKEIELRNAVILLAEFLNCETPFIKF